jgi:glycosyltransferase involved in cell wall biosynthesis
MHIGFLLHSNVRSGANLAMFEHADRLGRRGHRVRVLFQERFFAKSVAFFDPAPAFETGFLDEITAPGEPFDHLITNWWECPYRFERLPAYRYGYFRHGEEAPLYDGIGRFFDAAIDLVLEESLDFYAVSTHLRDDLQRRFGQEAMLIRNGVDLDRFRSAAPALPPRTKRLRVLVEGPIDAKHKRVPETLAMLAAIPEIEVAHVAADGSRPVATPVAHALGAVAYRAMGGVYASCDLLVKLSALEAQPMPVFEAFASGVPAVISAFPGHEEYIRDGLNALVVPIDDYAAARAAIEALLAAPDRLAVLRKGAVATVASLGWDDTSNRFEAVLLARSDGDRTLARTPHLARYRACYLDILNLWAHNTTLMAGKSSPARPPS